jgi:hypothetical protein
VFGVEFRLQPFLDDVGTLPDQVTERLRQRPTELE